MHGRILIVGGGIMGVSIAQKCAPRTRESLVLIEKKHLGAGSSGRSGAILRAHYRDAVVARMAHESLREYSSFAARTGLPLGFQRTGVITLAGPKQPEWCQRVRENVAMMQGLGIRVELVDAARMRALVPGSVIAEGSVGSWEPDGGFVDPNQTLASFAQQATELGAELRMGVELLELCMENGRVSGARTSAGELVAEQIVVVAGPWTRALLARHGLDFPLKVVRPENHYLGVPEMGLDPSGAARGAHPVLIDLELGSYARCDPANARTRIGRIDYDDDHEILDPDALDEHVSPELVRWGRAALSGRIPAYASRADAGSLAAWYTLTPDAQALIGPVPGIAGLFIVSGFSGHGFKLGPAVGEGVAQMLFGEKVTALDPAFFAPDRFQGGEGWGGRFGL
ncbi:MAG: FAD-binding oxidoreductase [Planctomycetes bacterium]|nr:FAD-binding oxidoreductase [Planctomycetota bacterium]